MKTVKDKLKENWFPLAIDMLPEQVVCKVYAATWHQPMEDLELAIRLFIRYN